MKVKKKLISGNCNRGTVIINNFWERRNEGIMSHRGREINGIQMKEKKH